MIYVEHYLQLNSWYLTPKPSRFLLMPRIAFGWPTFFWRIDIIKEKINNNYRKDQFLQISKIFFCIRWTIVLRMLQISWHTFGNPDIPKKNRLVSESGITVFINVTVREAKHQLIPDFSFLNKSDRLVFYFL